MLKGKNAIITGASRGIGREIALTLAENGANIVINYRNYNNEIEALVKDIEAKGVKIVTVKCDVSNFEEVENLISEAKEKLGSIDILVNNAGITKDGLLMRMKQEDFESVLDVNLKGVFNTTKLITPIMMKQRTGKIINISSVVGLVGNAGQCNYAASKAGVIGFSKSIARELAPRGVNINVVAPGYIDTDMTKVLSDEQKKSVLDMIPLSRMGSVDDISNAVAFLASDEAAYITGQVISVDGGMNI